MPKFPPPKFPPIITIGSAIVDILGPADDATLNRWGMKKGAMMLFDTAAQAKALYNSITPAAQISGGSAANTAVGIASCGGRVGFIGVIGRDDIGTIFAQNMRDAGVYYQPKYDDTAATGSCIILITPDGERTMNTHLGAASRLTPDDIDDALISQAQWVYLEGYLFDALGGEAVFQHIAEVAKNAGTKLALSLSDSWCVERHRENLHGFIENNIDLLFGNGAEIAALMGCGDAAMVDAARSLAPEVAITLGAAGSMIISGKECITLPAEQGGTVIDTTGAGDIFAAGYLYTRFQGGDLRKAGQAGTKAAAHIISITGGRPTHPLATILEPL